jgi:aromatic ring-cleaving dioxygenase
MNTELAPYHAHIYYDLDDRGTAERLHQEFSKSKGLGDLANLLFVGEMRTRTLGRIRSLNLSFTSWRTHCQGFFRQ